MQSYYNRYANQFLTDYYSQSNLTPAEFDSLLFRYWSHDANGFWNRSWQESMSAGQGGAGETVVAHVGETQDLFRVSALALNNEGKITTGDIRLLLDTIRAPPDPNAPEASVNIRKVVVLSGFQYQETYKSKFSEVSVKPNIAMRFSTKPVEIINSISIEAKVKFFSSRRTAPMLIFSVEGQYSPAQNYGMLFFVVEVGVW